MQMPHRCLARTELYPLKLSGQPAAGPELLSGRRVPFGVAQHHEGGKILVLRTQRIGHPGSEDRPAGENPACLEHVQAFRMVVVLGVHGADHAQVVGHCGEVGRRLAQLDTALPVLAKLKGAGEQHVCVVGLVDLDPVRVRLTGALRQLGLGVEKVHLAGAAVLDHLNHSLRPAR